MEITVNGENREVEKGLTLTRLLGQLGIEGRNLAVEHNGQFLEDSHRWDSVVIGQGDTLEIVHFVGGG